MNVCEVMIKYVKKHYLNVFILQGQPAFSFRFLPNQLICKIPFQRKLFCGVFSKDGEYFFSGCQGDWLKFNFLLFSSEHL